MFPSLSNPSYSVVIVVARAEGGLPFGNTEVLLSSLRSFPQLQSIIKKVIAHFHDFSVLFSVVSSISQRPLETCVFFYNVFPVTQAFVKAGPICLTNNYAPMTETLLKNTVHAA